MTERYVLNVRRNWKVTLYEIDQQIMSLVDPETGELSDYEAFQALRMEWEKKVEGMALWVKNLSATIKGIKEEIDNLSARKKALDNQKKRLESYISQILDGQKFSTPRCVVSFRNSTSVQVDNAGEAIKWLEQNGFDDCIKYSDPEIRLTEIRELLKDGTPIPGVHLSQKTNVGVK